MLGAGGWLNTCHAIRVLASRLESHSQPLISSLQLLTMTSSHFLKKVLANPELAQVGFRVEVLEKYLCQSDVSVKRTDTVGRVKAATWFVDFGIAPDEQTLHAPISALKRLPEAEQNHWLSFADGARYSENFLKMQSSHSCIDDGGLRNWGEESLF
jgi:hypothetical protein